jgi:hypothetical protein
MGGGGGIKKEGRRKEMMGAARVSGSRGKEMG